MAIVGIVFSLAVLMFLSSVWRGCVLSILWAWFVVPVTGLPVVSIPMAIGLSLVVSFLTYQADAAKDDDGDALEKLIVACVRAALYPAICLFIGWILTMFL